MGNGALTEQVSGGEYKKSSHQAVWNLQMDADILGASQCQGKKSRARFYDGDGIRIKLNYNDARRNATEREIE